MKKLYPVLVLIIVSFLFFLSKEIVHLSEADGLKVTFFDVGQGDSALIQRDDYQILIDGGPSDEVLTKLGQNMSPLDRKLELVILTHPHADHLVGLNKVLDRYDIGEIISSGVIFNSTGYIEFLEKVKTKHIALKIAEKGSIRHFLDHGSITYIWPGSDFTAKTASNTNNSSEVVKICYLLSRALFMGDLEKDGQEQMLQYYGDNSPIFKSDIIKVAHHGSSNALLPALYESASPKYAVLSAGKDNQFGHPHQSVIDYLMEKTIEIFRTDQNGIAVFNLSKSGVEKR